MLYKVIINRLKLWHKVQILGNDRNMKMTFTTKLRADYTREVPAGK